MSVHPQKYHRRVNDRYTRRTSILLRLMKLVVRPSLRCCHVFVLLTFPRYLLLTGWSLVSSMVWLVCVLSEPLYGLQYGLPLRKEV